MAGLVRASPSSDGRCGIPAGKGGLETRGDFRSIRPVRQVLLVYLFRVVQDTLHGLGCSDGKEVVVRAVGTLLPFVPSCYLGFC